jgi:hypothetical protein
LTYIYVRKDLPSFIPDPEAQSLLVAFLKALYNDDYVTKCEEDFGFVRITGALRDLALEGIEMLQISPEAPTWVFESSAVLPEGGQGDYVISARRKLSFLVEQDHLVERTSKLELELEEALTNMDRIEGIAKEAETTAKNADLLEGIDLSGFSNFDEGEEKRLNVAFILSIVSLCLWFVTTAVICVQLVKLQAPTHPVEDEKN